MVLTSIILLTSFVIKSEYINPTGTYKLGSGKKNKNGEIYGYFGQIQVKKIAKDKIVMTFEINKGAPSYNSGSFVDTLIYKNNRVSYTNSQVDTSCVIVFDFVKKGVKVKQKTSDYYFGCGFGQSVIADGFYKMISKEEPILKEPLTERELVN